MIYPNNFRIVDVLSSHIISFADCVDGTIKHNSYYFYCILLRKDGCQKQLCRTHVDLKYVYIYS